MTASTRTTRARQLLDDAGRAARDNLRRFVAEPPRTAPAGTGGARLAPTTALRENGFTVFRGLFTPGECDRMVTELSADAGIRPSVKYTKVDAINHVASARRILLEGRIIDAVAAALGERPRFLQVGDLHYLHDTAGWHRDSVHRAHDSSEAPDWRDTDVPFGVVKAIVYLESDNAAMGIMAGSHRSPIEMDRERVAAIEASGGQLVIDAGEDPNRRLTDAQKRVPLAWKAEVGDVLVFDERTYHAGRRVDQGRVTTNREAAKMTLSLVFGLDNAHSERMYSYFRYVRSELNYRDLDASLADELARRGLVLSRGWGDYYADHPEDLVHVYLRDPGRLDQLLAGYGHPQRAS